MDWNDVVLRTMLALVAGFGFIAPTLSAVASLAGFDARVASVVGILGGLCSFVWIATSGRWID